MSAIIPQRERPAFTSEQLDLAKAMRDPDFSLTRFMAEQKRREATGDAEREREAAALEAAKAADLEAAKLAEEQAKAKAIRKARPAEMEATAAANISKIKAQAEQTRADWEQARISSLVNGGRWY